jgi:flagellar protein FliO/FliZ
MKLGKLTAAATAATAAVLGHVATAYAVSGHGENTPLNLDPPRRVAAGATAGGGSSLVRTVVGLGVVIAVIYGLHWVLKQVKSSREERSSGSGLVSLATVALGPGRALHMVRAGREVVIVGVGEKGVTPIRVYAEAEARAAGLLDDARPPAEQGGDSAAPASARTLLGDAIDTLRRRTVR